MPSDLLLEILKPIGIFGGIFALIWIGKRVLRNFLPMLKMGFRKPWE